MTWLWSRRGRFTLGAVGLVLTIAPIVGAQVLVDRFTHERAHVETAALAADFLSLSVNAIASGVNAVNHLVLDGISGCDPHALSTMQRVTATSVPVKAVAMIDADGSVRCNQFGGTDAIEPLSLMQPLADGTTSLGLVRLKSTDGEAVMVLRARPDGSRVAAFVASDALAIGNLPRVLRGSMVGALELANGVSLAGFGPSPTEAAEHDPISAVATSLRFPVSMRLSAPYSVYAVRYADLLFYIRLCGGLVSTLLFALLVYLLKGPPVEIARLREAAARGEFVPYYQPMIDISTGRLVGCEVLMRWQKPNGTVLDPDSFILLAESSGLAVSMTRSLMRAVRADLDQVMGARPQLKVGINLFNDHFTQLSTVRDIEGIFRGASMSFNQLVFEITERQPLRNIQRAKVIIRALQALGARVALDDAGAGHGGLAYLHHLGVDVVKIDRLFIETIGAGRTASPIVDSLIKLGHDLGMEVVAEGVETFEQLDYLRQHGADSAQGYLFSPPLTGRMFLDLVGAMEPAGRDLPGRPVVPPARAQAEPAQTLKAV